jgi:hypothetical protein
VDPGTKLLPRTATQLERKGTPDRRGQVWICRKAYYGVRDSEQQNRAVNEILHLQSSFIASHNQYFSAVKSTTSSLMSVSDQFVATLLCGAA